MKKIIIAIDGPAGSGKSTTAKEVAQRLNYIYIDTGAMYRAAALGFKRLNLDFTDEDYHFLMNNIKIDLVRTPNGQLTFLNGEDVSSEIRNPEITKLVSPVSAHPIVRKELIEQQRLMGTNGGIVMDGRDIGTVVFPSADLKIFMIASPEARASRRTRELIAMGIEANEEEIRNQLIQRDNYDSTREHSPLIKADDAFQIDTSNITIEEQTNLILNLASGIINQ
jgi:cytidylate kinase